MKAYVITTGVIFGLLTVAHGLRMITESSRFATDPAYLGITALSAVLTCWAFYVARRKDRS